MGWSWLKGMRVGSVAFTWNLQGAVTRPRSPVHPAGDSFERLYMFVKVLVVDEVEETFDTKKGPKTLHLLVCQDLSRPPLRNSFDYQLTQDELVEHGKLLVEKTVELNIRDMSQNFSGRIRMTGSINQVLG